MKTFSEKQKEPLVSIGIPTYNNPEGLKTALRLLTGQTWTNLEIVVSDNCSPGEETKNVVMSFAENDARIRYFRQNQTSSPVDNFHFVFQQATAEYFMWAADDDEWEPTFVDECMFHLLNKKNVVLSFTRMRRIDPVTREVLLDNFKDNVDSDSDNMLWRSFKYTYNSAANCTYYGIYRKKLINENFFITKFGGDQIDILSIVYDGKIHISDKVLFSNGRYGMSQHREYFHQLCPAKWKKIVVNISSTFMWMYEFLYYAWTNKRYKFTDRLWLSLFILLRFCHYRYVRRFAGDMRALLIRPAIWKFKKWEVDTKKDPLIQRKAYTVFSKNSE
ncbi:MAG: glycosyltransferase family 2 protein [Fibrobacteria bacterium]|nr:glycosyltransferase family 2 protein [Fibrobacteria bacterium]